MRLQLLQQLHLKVEMYLGFQQVSLGYAAQSAAEHQQLLQLLRDNQSDLAVALLQRHIADAAATLQQHLALA